MLAHGKCITGRLWSQATRVIPALIGLAIALHGPAAAARCSDTADHTINVRNFGAVGDGVTDDSGAFQAAADCLAQTLEPDGDGRSSGVLLLPPGHYLLKSPVVLRAATAALRGGGLTVKGESVDRTSIIASSGQGALIFRLPATRPWYNFLATVKDISFVADVAAAGPAIAFDPVQSSPNDDVPKVTAILRNLSISGAGKGYFTYGVRAEHLMLPTVENVHMNGLSAATACFEFADSYGATVRDSSCSGASTGVSTPRAAEGNVIAYSVFSNVNVGVAMDVVPGRVPGPSSAGGLITGNFIQARDAGVVIDSKTWFTISKNFLSLTGRDAGSRVVLRDTQKVVVSDNRFLGDGGIGVEVLRGRKPWPHAASDTMIANNDFGALAHAISIGRGTSGTVVVGNRTADPKAIQNQGNSMDSRVTAPAAHVACRLVTWPVPGMPDGGAIVAWSAPAVVSGAIDHGVGAVTGPLGSRRITLAAETSLNATFSAADGLKMSCSSKPLGSLWRTSSLDRGETINVKTFGARGDGATDDTQALGRAAAAAFAALNAGGMATLYFPAGTYKTTAPIVVHQGSAKWRRLTIIGDGPAISTIVATGGNGLFDLAFSAQTPTAVAGMTLVGEAVGRGTAISVSMPPGGADQHSLTVSDLRVNGDETSHTDSFDVAIRGTGLSDPTLRDVRMVGNYIGTAFRRVTKSGNACLVLNGVWGLDLNNVYCSNMTNGYEVASRGGQITIWGGHALASVADVGVQIDAGGGDVTIESAHVNSAVHNFDISDARSFALLDTLTLNQDRAGDDPTRATTLVRATRRVQIEDDLFNQAGPICPAPSRKPFLCYPQNKQRTSVELGNDVGEATVSDNIFNEPGTSISAPASLTDGFIAENMFLRPGGTALIKRDASAR